MIQLALVLKMTTAQVVQTSVTVNNYSPIQDYVHPDDQTQPTFYFLINLRLFQTLRQITNRWRKTKTITKFQVENCFICSMQENRLIFTCFYFVISTFWLSLCKPQSSKKAWWWRASVARGGTPHIKGVGMLVVSLKGVSFGFWSHLGCSGQNTIIFSREDLV